VAQDIIEAPSLDVVRGLDARTNIGYAVEAAAASDSEPDVHEDYVSAYDLGASRSRPGSCGITPNRTRCCAILLADDHHADPDRGRARR
jgi:hypothetical protein